MLSITHSVKISDLKQQITLEEDAGVEKEESREAAMPNNYSGSDVLPVTVNRDPRHSVGVVCAQHFSCIRLY